MNIRLFIRKAALCTIVVMAVLGMGTVTLNAQQLQNPSRQVKLDERLQDVLKKSENSVYFQENKGQWAPDVLVAGNTNIGQMLIKKDHFFFTSVKPHTESDEEEAEEAEEAANGEEAEEEEETEIHRWGMFFEGFNPNYNLVKRNELATKFNYFIGDHQASNVGAYGEVALQNIYNGIDLRLYSQNNNEVEFDWVVNPGADYKNIKMRFKGQDGLSVNEKGELQVKLEFDNVKFAIPEAYQVINGKKVMVKAAFTVVGDMATFKISGNIDANYPLIIDPSLKWGVWVDGNNSNGTFDEYLFAVEHDSNGDVFCGGIANQQFTDAYVGGSSHWGYSDTDFGSRDGIIYEINNSGTQILRITYYGGTGSDGIYGLSLSPDESRVFVCGFTAGSIPAAGTQFDNARSGTDGYVACFSSDLSTLVYSSYLGSDGTDRMVSVRALSNNSFVIGGRVADDLSTSAPDYIVNAYDNTRNGGLEMYIAKFTNFNTLTFGTYVGGSSNDDLNDVQVFSDGSVAFSGYTSSSTATFPTLVNAAASGVSSNQDGVVGVIPANGGTFSMLSRIGGSGNDIFNGMTIGPNDTIYLTGLSASDDFPLGTGASAATRFSATRSSSNDAIVAKIPKAGKTGAGDPWMATYFGGNGDDRGNTVRTYATGGAVMIFGETQSSNFPTLQLTSGGTSFYDDTYNGGWDVFWMALSTNLKTQLFGTYVGGSRNDYLGETGEPAGSNHFTIEGDSLIVLGTTFHSTTVQPTVIGPTSGSGTVFDFTRADDNNDVHIVFKWRIGAIFNYDNGDAPVSYGTGRHQIITGLRIGASVDNEDFYPATPGTKANVDDLNGLTPDDENGISGTQVLIADAATTYSVTVPITNTAGSTAVVAGWIDFNRNGTFDANEVDTARVANGATSATLTWSGFNFSTLPLVDTSYLRIRIANDALFNVANPTNTGNWGSGEVEDYLVIRYHCVTLTGANISTTPVSTCGGSNGSLTVTNTNLITGVTYSVYYRKSGGALVGPFNLTATNNGTVTITGLSAGTYTMVQIFHPTNPACGDSINGSFIINSPSTPAAPTITTPAPVNVCVGGSFTITATGQSGATFAWSGPGGFSNSTASFTRSSAVAGMAGTYTVTQTVNNCTSPPATILVNVNNNPTLTATTSTPTVCTGATITLNATASGGTAGYSYSWSGPSSFTSTQEDPTRGPATTAMSGVYNVTVTDARNCTAAASTPNITVNTGPTVTAGSGSPTYCSGATIQLNSTPSPAGTYTYAWSGPASFTANTQNPTRANATTAFSGVYTVTITASNSCTAVASTPNITVNQSPTASASSVSPSYCTGATMSFLGSASSGTTPYSYSWSGPAGFSSTAQNPTRANALTTYAGVYTLTVTDANTCTAVASTPNITVNSSPSITATNNGPNYCSGQTITITSTPSGGTTPYTYSWSGPNSFSTTSQNVSIPNAQVANSGTYSVTVTSANTCTAAFTTPVLTVRQSPTITAGSSSTTYCAGTTIVLTSSPASGTSPYTYSWSGPSSFTSTAQNPTRPSAITGYSGVYAVTVTDANTCTASAQTPNITVNPGLTVNAGSNSAVCSGGTLQLSSSATGGTSPFVYVWAGPSSFSSALQNPTVSGVSAANAGTYSVTITDQNSCSGTANTVVAVNPTASLTVSSNSPVCAGGTITLSASLSGGTGPFNYSWTGPISFTSTSGTPSRANALTTYSGTYNVTVTDANGCSGVGSTSVTVNPTPAITAGSNTPVCTGDSIKLTSSPSGGTTPYTYAWTGPASFTSTLQNPNRPGSTTAMGGLYTVVVTDNRSCSASASTTVVVNARPSVTAGSNTPVCETKTIGLTSTPSGGNGTYTYVWSGPLSFSSNIQNPTRANALSAHTGTYTVRVTDGNGCSVSASTGVTVLPKPGTPTANAVPNPVCTGQTLNLSGSGDAGAGWNWFGPAAFTSTLQNPSVSNVTVSNGGQYGLYQSLAGCISDTAFVTVVVNLTPSAPTVSASPNPICTGQTLTLTATGTAGASFTWSGPNGYTASGSPATRTNVTTSMAGNYTATQTLSGCTSPSSLPVNVVINQTPTAPTPTSNSPRCYGDTLRIFAATVSGATYSWSGPSGYTSAVQNPVRPNATPAMSGTYSLTVTVNGCSSTNNAVTTVTVTTCPPNAVNDNYTTPEDQVLTVPAPGVLTNDSDPSNPQQPLTVTTTPTCNPAHGTVALAANGSFTYTPATNYNGLDSFCYRVCDNEVPAACDTAVVFITVTPLNDPPVVPDSSVTTPEDVPTTVCLPITDPDAGNSHILSSIYCGPSHGTITTSLNNGSTPHTLCVTYTPATNYNGQDTLCLVVCDNGTPQLCDTSRVTITVTPVNDKPNAVDDIFVSCTDTAIKKNVMINDSDVDGPFLQVVGTVFGAGPFTGTLTSLQSLGNFTYTPTPGFNGVDSFKYVLCDGGTPTLCDTATVILDYRCVNLPPIAVNDNYTINEDQTLNNNVSTNDSDPDGGTLTYNTTPVDNVNHGTLTLNTNGTFTYVPTTNYFGTDTFIYSVCDNGVPVKCDTAMAVITILPVNDPPFVPDTTVTTPEDTPRTVCLPVTDIDVTDQHIAALGCTPLHGTVTNLTVTNIGTPHTVCFTYTPTTNYNGSDSLCIIVCDNGTPSKCDTSTVRINITPVNDPPVAINDFYTTNEDVTLNVPTGTGVRANDNDNADGNPVTSLTVTGTPVVNPQHGTLTLNANGSFTYVPQTNFFGTDSFQYRVCDNGTPLPSLCDTATAYITILTVNDPPFVPDTTVTTPEDTPKTVCIPVTDADSLDQHASIVLCTAQNGTLTNLTTTNIVLPHTVCVTYTPNTNFNGTDSFCLLVCDNGIPFKCDTSIVHINVTPVNDPPVAINDFYTTSEDVTLNVPAGTGVRANDNDNADGNPVTSLTVTGTPVVNPQHGTLTLNGNGSFTYVPQTNFFGTDSFQYRVCDSGTPPPSLCDTATAYITILTVNDPPVVPDTTVTTPEDTPKVVCLPITDPDITDQHASLLLCAPGNGTITNVTTTNIVIPHTVCITYNPNTNFNGVDSFCVLVCDNGVPFKCDTSVVHINVTPVNDPPVAVNDNYTTNKDVTLNVPTGTGVRANDNDNADGNPVTSLTITTVPVINPVHGTVTLTPTGSFIYVPAPGYAGLDSFQYRVCDSGTPPPSLCDTGTAYITIVYTNTPPEIPDTTIHTPEDTPTTVCVPITDIDILDIHSYSLCGSAINGTITQTINNGSLPHTLCITYTPFLNFNGTDSICVIVCDNGTPSLCDTTHITIIVDPRNDPPYADTIRVVTYQDHPVGVNVASATGDPDGNPLTYTYGSVIPANGTYAITGNGAIVVTPNPGFSGTFVIPYSVCDLSPYPVTSLCDSAAIIVTVLPGTDTLVNHAPVASNDYVSIPRNSSATVNQLANDFDPDGDALAVTVTGGPAHGTYSLNANGTINYTPNTNFYGYDTIHYTICDPTAVHNPKPLCSSAIVVILISYDPQTNHPPVAADDYKFICADANATMNVLANDNDPDGDVITSVSLLSPVSHGSLVNASLGIYYYTPNTGFAGNDTLVYVMCDNGTPSLCDTGTAVFIVNPTPVITASVSSLTTCSNDSVNITFTSNVPGTTIYWNGSNGTNGTGDIHTVLTNTGTTAQVVTYTVTGTSPSGCGSTAITVRVLVNPRPVATANVNGSLFCSGEPVVINVSSNVTSTTYAWSGSNGTSGTGSLIADNPVNNGTTNLTVTYNIIPTANGCTGDTLKVSVTVKPKPVLTVNPGSQTVCSGTPVTINVTSNITGTSILWTGSNGNSGNVSPINDSPFNGGTTNVTVTYTINGSLNGCPANTVTSTVIVRPRVIANAGNDNTATTCSGSCVTLGGSPTASGGTGAFVYHWAPAAGLSDTAAANPTACGLPSTTTYTLVVTDGTNCSASDQVTITIVPSSLTAEAGVGGAFCLSSGDSVMLGGFPTAVGGTPPYTYAWAPAAGLNTTNTANPSAYPTTLGPNKYFVTVTDALGCTSVDSTIVTVYPALLVNAGADTVTCASIPVMLGGTPTASGGSGTYTYFWTPTAGLDTATKANPVATLTVTTTFSVSVTDGNGCHATDNILVTVRPAPVAHGGPDKTLVLCAADSVTIGDNPIATGGTAPYTILWTPGTGLSSTTVANPVVKGLTANTTYTLTVTDTNGCVGVDFVTVNAVQTTLFAQAGANQQKCFGNCAQLGAFPPVVGGTPPYTYHWNGNLADSTQPNPIACPAVTTTYTLVVTDAKGCTATSSVTITINPNPVANAGPDTTVCTGKTVTIGGNPSASGGTPGYTYTWNPSIGLSLPNVANPAAAPTAITTYELVVTDSKGCADNDQVTVTPRTNPVVDAGPDKNITSCVADSVILGGSPVASNGSAPYTYAWTPNTGLYFDSLSNPWVKGINATTSYQLIVTDVYGCSGTDFATVFVVPSTLQAEAGNSGVVCAAAGTPVTLGGSPTAAGGVTPYVYHWSPGNFLQNNDSTAANPIAVVSTTTVFYVTVTDAKGCTSVDSVRVTQNPAPTANAGADTAFCQGFCVNLGTATTGTGGTGPYQYLWAPTIGLNANNQANPLACPNVTTVYTVQVTDSNGCTASDNVTVIVRPNPSANAGPDKTITTCSGDSVQIGGTPSATGGVGPYTYVWSPAGGLFTDSIANPWVKGISISTLYALTVTDANGCTATDPVAVVVVPSTLVAEAGNNTRICRNTGTSVTLGGAPTANGGAGPYTYTWAGGAINLSNPANPVATPLLSTTYYLTVTDSKGCMSFDSIRITVTTPPVVNAGIDTAICAGLPVRLGGAPTASGVGPFTYAWTPGTGLSSVSAANPIANAPVTGNYSVVVTDSNGCTATDAILITVHQNPVAHAGPDQTLTACSQDSVCLGDSPSATGGTPGYHYLWTPRAGMTSDTLANPCVRNISGGITYTLVVTDSFGCKGSDQVAVNVINSTLVVEAGNNVAFCEGASISVTLGGNPTAIGGQVPYSYSWTPGAANIPNPVVSPTQTTTYTVVVTDANGCVGSDTVKVTINPRPVVNAGLNDTVCAGACVTLGGAPTASGGTGSVYTYNWTPAFFFSTLSTIANPVVCPTNNITYVVTVRDSIGCTNTGTVSVRVNQNPVANAGADKTLVACPNSCIVLGASPTASSGTPGYSYAWLPATNLNNNGLPNPTLCNFTGNVNVSVTVTDANGCTATDVVNVVGTPSNLVVDAGNNIAICAGGTTCVTIGGNPTVASSNASPYSLVWSPAAGMCTSNTVPNPQVNPNDTTTYVVLATDSLGCTAVDSMTVIANPAVTVSVGSDTAICNGSCALLGGNPTASGGTGAFTYSWTPGTGLSCVTCANPTACPTNTTSYCITITDSVGCSASTCQRITVNPAITACAGNDVTITNCPGSFVQVGCSPTGSGGSGNYSYSWSPDSVGGVRVLFTAGQPNPVIANLTVTTTFTVTVTDNVTGCSATDQVTVFVNQSTLAAEAGLNKVFCSNSGVCVNIGGNPTATGGAGPYIYQWSPGGLNDPNISNPCASPIITTVYTVTVTDQLGCTATDSATVIVDPLMALNAGADTTICYATSIVLGGNPTVIGGTAPYIYNWSPPFPYINNTSIANPTASNVTSSISYTLTVRDSFGCSAQDVVAISVRSLPTASAGPDETIFACTADSVVIGGAPTASGTTGPYTYQWTPPFSTSLSSLTVSNPTVRNLGFTTQFCVIVTDSFGCQASDCQTTTVLPNTLFVEAGNSSIGAQCANQTSCVTLGGFPAVTGGSGQYSYQWFGVVSNPIISNPQACPSATTTYTLVVTDNNNGCQASDTVQIIINTPPSVNVTGFNTSRAYCTNDGPVTLTGTPAGGSFSGPGIVGNTFQPALVGQGFWCITYTYTDQATSCTDDTTICVTVNPQPVVNVTGSNGSYCRNEVPDTLFGTPVGGTFTGPGMSGSVFTPANANIGANIITYTYTDSVTGCSNSIQFTINVNGVPLIAINANDTSCAGQSVILSPNYSVDVTNIQWSHLGGTIFASGLSPVTYTPTGSTDCVVATAVNTSGCAASDTLCITVNPVPVVNILGLDSAYCIDAAPVTLVGSPAGGVFSGPGVTAGVFNPAAAGAGVRCIGYRYMDANGCFGDTSICVVVNPLPTLNVTGYASSYCSYDAPVTLTGTPAGGTFSGPGISGNVFTPATATTGSDTITYAYTDTNTGCSNIYSFVIQVKPQPTIVVAASTDSACANVPVTLSPNYSLDVTNIQWTQLGGNVFASGLNPVIVTPAGPDFCAVAAAVSNNGCVASDTICMHINQSPVANNDLGETCEELPVTVNVTANDFDLEGDSNTVTIIDPAHGTAVLDATGDSIVYTPDTNYNGADTVTYILCNSQCANACDTAQVLISICPINDAPVVTDATDTVCRETPTTVCVTATDADGDPLTYSTIACSPVNGTVTVAGNCVTYTPAQGFVGTQTICLSACDNSGLCDTATITVVVEACNRAPIAVNDAASVCDNTTVTLQVLNNDTDADSNTLTVTAVSQPAFGQGVISFNDSSVTYMPGSFNGNVTLFYIVCDNGVPSLCDTASILLNITHCVPVNVTTVFDTTCRETAVSGCITANVTGTSVWHITGFCTPQNGTITLNGDSCYTYTPDAGFIGTDVFCVTVCDNGGYCDTANVSITTLDCDLQAIDDPCDLDTTAMNTPITVDELANDIIPAGSDTTVTVLGNVSNGTTAVNDNLTITVTPMTDYTGSIQVTYQVCVTSGTYSYCDTAEICVTVVDTVEHCFIPNAFSPNGDGTNDELVIPCNQDFPKADLRVFDRWGVEVWASDGHYLNDFKGKNMQGTELPDGTYYLIYTYNDGTGKRDAKFVVIHR